MSSKQKHNAIVTRNVDDDIGLRLRGGVYFEAPTLFDGEYPVPAMPMFPFAGSVGGAGMFWVPKVGDEIEVELETDDGSWETTDVELPEPRYTAMVYSEAADLPEIFKKNYPNRMGWVTNSGHYLLFDDTEKEKFLSLVSSGGHILKLDDTNKLIEVMHKQGGKLKISETKVELIDNSGNQSVILEAGKITQNSTQEHRINTEKVYLGSSASFHAALAENVVGLHDSHNHIGNLGSPTSPPIVPMSSKAGTPLDPTALRIYLKGNT